MSSKTKASSKTSAKTKSKATAKSRLRAAWPRLGAQLRFAPAASTRRWWALSFAVVVVAVVAARLVPRAGLGLEDIAPFVSSSWETNESPGVAFADDSEALARALRYGPPIGVSIDSRPESTITIETEGGFVLDPKDESLEDRTLRQKAVRIEFGKQHGATVEGVYLGDSFRLRSVDGSPLGYKGGAYEGWLEFLCWKLPDGRDRWVVVNRLPIERYLLGVIGSEMSASWPIEALEAQAIAARTYALYKLATTRVDPRNETVSDRIHVFADTRDQMYKGRLENARILTAVENTRGQVLFYGNEIFEPKYHSTCGGATANGTAAFGQPVLPVHTSAVCGYCADSPKFKWKAVRFSEAQVRRALASIVSDEPKIQLGEVTKIEPVDPGPGGHASYFRVTHARGSFEVDAILFRLRLDPMAMLSTACVTQREGDDFVFHGRGFGHGVGMCQYGAKGLADRGADSIQIVAHYYTDADVKQLW